MLNAGPNSPEPNSPEARDVAYHLHSYTDARKHEAEGPLSIARGIMVLSKQLSSSYLPISALVMNERVYAPIADESHAIGTLGTG